jgi:putative DNA primase/helicase
MLCPKTVELRDHNPKYYSTNRLPYKYDKKAECPLWIKSLSEILEDDKSKIGVLQEFFGYCLTRDTKQHKALLLLGESRSGKSTILHILRHLVGETNCSSVPLKFISNPQHTPDLVNKLVNIDTDVSAKAAEFEAEFKTITSGEPLRTNQKFIQAFSFVPYCKVVMAANIFPKITDHSSAFYNRLILIPCDRVFSDEEQNRDLPIMLLEELSGIMNWAIEGLRRLEERGKFEQLDFMKDAVEELENENNPVNLFFDEHIAIDMGGHIEKGDLYNRFKEWAEKNNNYKLSAARFASCVFKKYHKQTPKDVKLQSGGKRIWRNLKYIYEKQENQQEVKDWAE